VAVWKDVPVAIWFEEDGAMMGGAEIARAVRASAALIMNCQCQSRRRVL